MNSDNRLCEYDLFASIKSTNNKLFIDTINQDFIDIRAKMQQKEIDSGTFEVTKSMNNDTMQITDLKRWLSERESKYAIQETFYKVFQQLIKNKSNISVLSQFYWLSSRYIKIKTQDKGNFYLMLIQAPIIAVLICMIFADVTGAVPFISAIAAIWFGSNNAAKEIVSEMAIYKRERMYNLSIFPYIFSKISVLSLFSVIQSAIYIIVLYVYFSNQTVELANPIQAFCWMSFVSIVSSLFGLCISSLSKTTEIVMTTVPIVLIPQIMLAGLIAKIGSPIVELISYLTLSRWSTEGFNIIQEKIMVPGIGAQKATEKLSLQFHESYKDLPLSGTLALDFFVLSSMFFVFLFVIHYSLKKKDPLKI